MIDDHHSWKLEKVTKRAETYLWFQPNFYVSVKKKTDGYNKMYSNYMWTARTGK